MPEPAVAPPEATVPPPADPSGMSGLDAGTDQGVLNQASQMASAQQPAQPTPPPQPLHSRIAEGIIHAFAGTDGTAGSALRSALAGGLAGLAAASNRPPGNVPRGAAALGGFGAGATAAVQQGEQQRQQALENKQKQTTLDQQAMREKYLNAETQARTYADQITANNASQEGLQKRYQAAGHLADAFSTDHTLVGDGVTEPELIAEGGPGGKYDHTKVTGFNTGEKEVMQDGKMVTLPTFKVFNNEPDKARQVEVSEGVSKVLAEAGFNYPKGTMMDSKLLDSMGTKAMAAMNVRNQMEEAAAKMGLAEDQVKAAAAHGADMATINPTIGAYMAKHPDDFFGGLAFAAGQKGAVGEAAQRIQSSYDPEKLDKIRHERVEEQQKAIEDQNKARELALKNRAADGDIGSAAELLRSGSQAPSQLSKRASTYQATIDEADKQEMAATGKHYSPAQEEINYKFANQPSTQNTLKYLNSLTGGQDPTTGNLAELVNQSNKVGRTSFPPLNKAEAWAKLESGDPGIVAYRTVVTEVADQVAKILQGGGSGSGTSDAKMRQAQEMFDTGFTKDQIKAVAAELRPLLNNRRDALIGDNRYLQHDFGKPNKAPAAAVVVEKPPENHNFNQTTWAAANPGKDVNAAIAAAKAKGYTVTQ